MVQEPANVARFLAAMGEPPLGAADRVAGVENGGRPRGGGACSSSRIEATGILP